MIPLTEGVWHHSSEKVCEYYIYRVGHHLRLELKEVIVLRLGAFTLPVTRMSQGVSKWVTTPKYLMYK